MHPQRKIRKFRARWRSARANFFHAVLLVALVLLCDSVALKCGKPNKTTRKCAGKIYFLSKELARAAELQEGSAICRVHWDEIRGSNNRCSVSRNYGQVARESCCPKSCCPKPESCCPKFLVMSPENHGHVARNLRKKILKNENGFKNQNRVYIHSWLQIKIATLR